MSLHKVLIEQFLSLNRNLSAAHFMRMRKSSILNANEGVFQSAVWFQGTSDVAPGRYTEENFFFFFLHLHHAGASDLNFQIFSCMTSEIFDIKQFILFCSCIHCTNTMPVATLPFLLLIFWYYFLYVSLNESIWTMTFIFFWSQKTTIINHFI